MFSTGIIPIVHAYVSYSTSKSDASQPPEGAVVCEPSRLTDISLWTRTGCAAAYGNLAVKMAKKLFIAPRCLITSACHSPYSGFLPMSCGIRMNSQLQENGQTGLQMPQASVTSYFAEVSSGKWQLQLPEDATVPEFRCSPIRFSTTGFVHGSKKPLAIASCEATCLAHLRKDQWSNVSEKRRKDETYVRVRSSKFSAYRLGLATIVLELHEEDLEFL